MLELLTRRSPGVVSRTELGGYALLYTEVDTGNFYAQLHQFRKAIDKSFFHAMVHTLVGGRIVIESAGTCCCRQGITGELKKLPNKFGGSYCGLISLFFCLCIPTAGL
jgi:hypothetical protein